LVVQDLGILSFTNSEDRITDLLIQEQFVIWDTVDAAAADDGNSIQFFI
jgi:hypothetical protein